MFSSSRTLHIWNRFVWGNGDSLFAINTLWNVPTAVWVSISKILLSLWFHCGCFYFLIIIWRLKKGFNSGSLDTFWFITLAVISSHLCISLQNCIFLDFHCGLFIKFFQNLLKVPLSFFKPFTFTQSTSFEYTSSCCLISTVVILYEIHLKYKAKLLLPCSQL